MNRSQVVGVANYSSKFEVIKSRLQGQMVKTWLTQAQGHLNEIPNECDGTMMTVTCTGHRLARVANESGRCYVIKSRSQGQKVNAWPIQASSY